MTSRNSFSVRIIYLDDATLFVMDTLSEWQTRLRRGRNMTLMYRSAMAGACASPVSIALTAAQVLCRRSSSFERVIAGSADPCGSATCPGLGRSASLPRTAPIRPGHLRPQPARPPCRHPPRAAELLVPPPQRKSTTLSNGSIRHALRRSRRWLTWPWILPCPQTPMTQILLQRP